MIEKLKSIKRNVLHLQRQLRVMERELEQVIAGINRGESTPPAAEAAEEMATKVICHLNAKAGRKFSATSESTVYLIRCRMAEGWVEADFKAVIDTMVKRWNHDKQWSIYLRPQTLFGVNAESYLQAAKEDRGGIDTESIEALMIRRQMES